MNGGDDRWLADRRRSPASENIFENPASEGSARDSRARGGERVHGDEDERFRYAVASSRAVATPARDDDDACEVGGETSTPGEGGENAGC